jgi:RNA polymerase sigma-70 factor, ECF subfamily
MSNQETAAELFEQYQGPIFAYIYRLVDQCELANDLTQETFLQLVRHRDRLPEVSNRRAWLYRRYVTPVYRYVYSRVGNTADAEDLTSQVFTEAWASLDRYREQGTFPAWLFTIAARRLVDHYRRTRPLLPLEAAVTHAQEARSPLAETVHNEELAQMAALVGQLDEEKQELLRLRFAGGLTYAEMGAVTGRSEAAVKMAINRLLRHLQEMALAGEEKRDADECR